MEIVSWCLLGAQAGLCPAAWSSARLPHLLVDLPREPQGGCLHQVRVINVSPSVRFV